MKNTVELDRALKKRPKTLEALSLLLGGGVDNQKAIMRYYNTEKLSVKSVKIETKLITSLLMIIMAQIFPMSIVRSILSLIVLMIIPYVWTGDLLRKLNINTGLTIGLVITELMLEGLILGYLGLLDRNIIFIVLLISLVSKYLVIKFKK